MFQYNKNGSKIKITQEFLFQHLILKKTTKYGKIR